MSKIKFKILKATGGGGYAPSCPPRDDRAIITYEI